MNNCYIHTMECYSTMKTKNSFLSLHTLTQYIIYLLIYLFTAQSSVSLIAPGTQQYIKDIQIFVEELNNNGTLCMIRLFYCHFLNIRSWIDSMTFEMSAPSPCPLPQFCWAGPRLRNLQDSCHLKHMPSLRRTPSSVP